MKIVYSFTFLSIPLSIISLLFFIFSGAVQASALEKMTSNTNIFEQRTIYQQAQRAYKTGNLPLYKQLTEQLQTYPLYPYLVSLALNDSLTSLPYFDVDQFLQDNNDTVIGRRVLANWLHVLAEKKHWHDFRSYYQPSLRSTSLHCFYLWSRIKTADRTALKEVAALWNVKQSQPDECDPLFTEWIKEGYLTQDHVWSRYKKAINAKQYSLTRYLEGLANKDKKAYFKAFKTIHSKPAKLSSSDKLLANNNNYSIDIIKHGLTRLQKSKPEDALNIFKFYEEKQFFDNDFKQLFLVRHKKHETRQLSLESINNIANFVPASINPQELATLLLKSVREQDWDFYLSWYEKLGSEEKNSDQWLYWQARALEESQKKSTEKTQRVYQALAKRRSYYGFLAADKLRQAYAMQDKPLNVDNHLLHEVNHIPAIARARELFFVDNIRDARREWRDGSQGFSTLAVQASAKLANEWGWHRKAIEMLGSIKAWDHLTIRFPVMHQDVIEQKAKRFEYPASLIFAIARQESAWQKDATSHANARGLMQLIPSTALDAAKKVGVRHKTSQLYIPEHNILLGSFHVSELLEKYSNNRLPAIAAYNAGQHRVNQWMKKSAGKLPYDVWIETIPFKETRQYVKNVLYYSALYDYRAGNDINLLTALEKNTPL